MTDTDIAAVIARVRTAWRGEYRGGVQRTVELDASDRDALIAHIDAQAARIAELEHERDEARGVAHARAVAVDMGDAEADAQQARIAALEGAEGLRGLIASANNLVGVVRNKQWERMESKADSLDFAIKRARALLTTEKTHAG